MTETAWCVQNDFDLDKANTESLEQRVPFFE